MIKLYRGTASNKSIRQAVNYLEEYNEEYEVLNVGKQGISQKELFDILGNTYFGVTEILSTNSKPYKQLVRQGMDFDDLTLTQLLDMINKHTELLKYPILVRDNVTLVGFDSDEISTIRSRENRMAEHKQILREAQNNDTVAEDSEEYLDDYCNVDRNAV